MELQRHGIEMLYKAKDAVRRYGVVMKSIVMAEICSIGQGAAIK